MIWQNHQTIARGLRDQACADLLAARFLLISRVFTINHQPTSFAHVVLAKCQQACEKLLKGYFLFDDRSFDPTAGHRPLTDTLELSPYQLRRREKFLTTFNRGNPDTIRELKWIEDHAPHRPRPSVGDHSSPLAVLPHGLHFPEHFRNRVRYSAGNLVVSDRITGAERQELLALSPDPAYQTSLQTACAAANNAAGLPQPLNVIPRNTEYPFWSEALDALVTPAYGLNVRSDGARAVKTSLSFFKTLSRSDPHAYTNPIAAFFETYSLSSNLDEFPEGG